MALWSTKAAISLKRVKIQKKLLWEAYNNSPSLFRAAPFPTPYGLPWPRLGFAPPTKTPIDIISGTDKATNFKFGQNNNSVDPNKFPLKSLEKSKRGHIQGLPNFFGYPLLSRERKMLLISNLATAFRGSIRIKAHENFWRKGRVGVSRDCPIFRVPPVISETGEAKDFKFCTHIYRLNRNKSPLKISGRVAVGVVRDSRKFSWHPYCYETLPSCLCLCVVAVKRPLIPCVCL